MAVRKDKGKPWTYHTKKQLKDVDLQLREEEERGRELGENEDEEMDDMGSAVEGSGDESRESDGTSGTRTARK